MVTGGHCPITGSLGCQAAVSQHQVLIESHFGAFCPEQGTGLRGCVPTGLVALRIHHSSEWKCASVCRQPAPGACWAGQGQILEQEPLGSVCEEGPSGACAQTQPRDKVGGHLLFQGPRGPGTQACGRSWDRPPSPWLPFASEALPAALSPAQPRIRPFFTHLCLPDGSQHSGHELNQPL